MKNDIISLDMYDVKIKYMDYLFDAQLFVPPDNDNVINISLCVHPDNKQEQAICNKTVGIINKDIQKKDIQIEVNGILFQAVMEGYSYSFDQSHNVYSDYSLIIKNELRVV